MSEMKLLKSSTLLCVLLFLGNVSFGQLVKLHIKPEKEPTEKTGMIIRFCEQSELKKAEKEKRKVKWDSIGTLQKPIPFAKEYTVVSKKILLETNYLICVRLVEDGKLGKPCKPIQIFTPYEEDDKVTVIVDWKERPKTKPAKVYKEATVVNGKIIYKE